MNVITFVILYPQDYTMNNTQPTQPQSLGLFKAIGQIFGLVGTSVSVVSGALNTVDRTVANTGNIIDRGFEAVDMAIATSLTEMEIENSITVAELSVRKIEADKLVAELLAD